MAILHPQPPYPQQPPQQPEWATRLPPAGTFYPPPPGQPQGPPPPHGHHDPYRSGPPPQPQQNIGQSAPRQRTAIACKYCRRRKIRCSGFENSEDGRCSNCVRFSQECVFTPVSAQTQAFVPAQALYARGRGPAPGPQPLYGAYGQRLAPGQDGYPPHYQLPAPHQVGPYPPPPQHPGQPYAVHPYPQQPMMHDRRANGEPHTPTLPPPHHAQGAHMGRPEEQQQQQQQQQQSQQPGYSYPDPSGYAGAGASPSTAGPYPGGPAQPYYHTQQPPRRTSPTSVYSYEQQPRDSSSPNQQAYSYPPAVSQAPAPAQSSANNSRTPPPSHSASGSRAGMSIQDMVSENSNSGGERAAADSDMVNALNRAPRRA